MTGYNYTLGGRWCDAAVIFFDAAVTDWGEMLF